MSDEILKPAAKGDEAGAIVYALLAGTARGLDLLKRVPELARSRGWPAGDIDLMSVMQAAVALTAIGAGATLIHRPNGADGLTRGAWPRDSGTRTASQIVTALDLQRLLEGAITDPG